MNGTESSEVKLTVPIVVKGPFYGTERPENLMVWNVLRSKFNSTELSEQSI